MSQWRKITARDGDIPTLCRTVHKGSQDWKKQFQQWGADGGRMRAQRLTKARRKEIARIAGLASAAKRKRNITKE